MEIIMIPEEVLNELNGKLDAILAQLKPRQEIGDTMSADEVAVYLGISTQMVYTWSREGKIPSRKIGARRLFFRNEINEWLKVKGE